jgi:starvation-inducible outer membrane lipoprotein
MKKILILLALMLASLTACQSVPKERKNNCACLWEPLDGLSKGEAA